MILDRIHNAIPLPWRVIRIFEGGDWGYEVVSSEGKSLNRYLVDHSDGALQCAVSAIAPYALDYVIRAASKGGTEAVQIQQRFEAILADVEKPRTPEQEALRRRNERAA